MAFIEGKKTLRKTYFHFDAAVKNFNPGQVLEMFQVAQIFLKQILIRN